MSTESRGSKYGGIFGNWRAEKLLGTGSGGKSAVFSICRNNGGWMEYNAMKVVCIGQARGTRQGGESAEIRRRKQQAEQRLRCIEQLRNTPNLADCLDHRFVSWQDADSFGTDLLIRTERLPSLRSRMRSTGVLEETEILRVGRDICRALAVCHDTKLLHGNIKPENIFLSFDGSCKLGDFSLSGSLDDQPSPGIRPYLAPEQLSGQYDERSDIFCLGLVLYELANGNRLPFADAGCVRESQVRQRLSGEIFPIPQGISPALAHVILTACAYLPRNRYKSALEMLDALERLPDRDDRALAQARLRTGKSAPAPEKETDRGTQTHRGEGTKTDPIPLWKRLLPAVLAVAAVAAAAVLLLPRLTPETSAPPETTPDTHQAQTPPVQTVSPVQTESLKQTQPPLVLREVSVSDGVFYAKRNPYDRNDIWCCHIPQVYLEGGIADELNREIYDTLYEAERNVSSLIGQYYTWGRKDNLVSLLAVNSYQDSGIRTLYLIHFSAETGEKLTDTELLSAFGLTWQEFRELAREQLREYWKDREYMLEYMDRDLFDYLVEGTLADENLDDIRPFINSQGQLSFSAWIFSPAGSDAYVHLFTLSDGTEIPLPECGRDHSREVPAEPVALAELRPGVTGDTTCYVHAPRDSTLNFYSPDTVINRTVSDMFGKEYGYSIHADGNGPYERRLSFDLDGDYTRFTGWVVFLKFATNVQDNKVVEIYCDGVRVARYVMSRNSPPEEFDIDVTGVSVLEIVYPYSMGSNEQAAICDGWLE